MTESDFSWFKLLSFFGAGLLVFMCFVVVAGGIMLITNGDAFNGVFVILAGLGCGAGAVFVYKNYQNKTAPKVSNNKKK